MPRSRFLVLGSLALVLVLVGMWFAIVPKSAESPDSPAQVVVATTAPAILSDVAAVQNTRTSEPVVSPNPAPEADANTPTPSMPSDGDAFEVHVVRDEDDQPIVGARTLFDDPSLPGLPPDQLTNAQGIAHWNLRGNRDWVVYVVAPGRVSVSQGVSKEAGSVTLRMRLVREIVVRLVDESGAAYSPGDLGLDPRAGNAIGLIVGESCGVPGMSLDTVHAVPARASQRSWGEVRFLWTLVLNSTDSACVHAVIDDRILASQWIAPSTSEIALTIPRDEIDRFAAPFVVRALSAHDGSALEDVDVVVRTASGLVALGRTDSAGRARFDGVLAAEFDVDASGVGNERTSKHVVRPLDGEVIVHVKTGRVIRGVLVDQTGLPFDETNLSLYRVSQAGSTALRLAEVKTDADGMFEFSGVPLEAVVLIPARNFFGSRELPLESADSPAVHVVEAGGDALSVRFVLWAHD